LPESACDFGAYKRISKLNAPFGAGSQSPDYPSQDFILETTGHPVMDAGLAG
jgi:hypothetical protein